MKPIAWYDPTNGMVSTDKDSPLFTPLGQVLPLYTKQEQEPVAWRAKNFYQNQEGWFYVDHLTDLIQPKFEPLYTTPPQRTWVGLTKEERHEISLANKPYVADIMAAHEAKLKEKNT
jgi:hypothetical protein